MVGGDSDEEDDEDAYGAKIAFVRAFPRQLLVLVVVAVAVQRPSPLPCPPPLP